MLNLFAIEWLKVKNYRTFWILFLGFIISYPLSFYFMAKQYTESMARSGKMGESMIQSMFESPFIFPKIWQSASWVGGLFFILIGMLFILLITNEVQFRTHRQNIIDGWSRMEFLKAKFTLLIFFVLKSTGLVFITGLLVGLLFSPNNAQWTDGLYNVGYFALMSSIYLMLAFLVAIFIKRTGLAIIIYFAIVFILDNVLWLVLTLKESQIGYFMPLEVVDSLLPNPFKPKMMEKRTIEDSTLVISAFVYFVLYAFAIIRYFKKSDLKT